MELSQSNVSSYDKMTERKVQEGLDFLKLVVGIFSPEGKDLSTQEMAENKFLDFTHTSFI